MDNGVTINGLNADTGRTLYVDWECTEQKSDCKRRMVGHIGAGLQNGGQWVGKRLKAVRLGAVKNVTRARLARGHKLRISTGPLPTWLKPRAPPRRLD